MAIPGLQPRRAISGKAGDVRVLIGSVFAHILGFLALALASGPAAAQTAVKVALDWKFEGPQAPFLVAAERGYFAAEGLEVTIEPGSGSVEPINRVASGTHQIGFGDINTLIKLRDNNPASGIKAVFMVYNRPPFAIVGRKSRGIAGPKDLEGKRLGAPASDGAFAQWPIFARLNGIDVSKVTIENVGFPVREPMLAAGQVDAITGYSFSAYVSLKDRGVALDDIVLLLMADYGLNLYGNAIIVNPKFAAEHPEAVKGFLRAFLRGLKDTVANPARAIDAVLARNEPAKREIELERLRMAIRDNILTPEVKARGYGDVDMARLQSAMDQIAQVHKFRNKLAPSDIFDPSFLPEPAVRTAP
jgi:NitT/TauT family transport system substrate-binding protein